MGAHPSIPEMDPMDADEGPDEDRVKTAATIVATVPRLVIEVGWSYLMMKRRAKKCAKQLRRSMVEGGMPVHMAKYLADGYAAEISARELIRNLSIPGVDIRVKDKGGPP
jgi:hypothetical protein